MLVLVVGRQLLVVGAEGVRVVEGEGVVVIGLDQVGGRRAGLWAGLRGELP